MEGYFIQIKGDIINEKIIIHVGLHKTATTFLQQEIFPKIENINIIEPLYIWMKLHPSKINLISNEILSGFPFGDNIAEERFSLINRLKLCFPDAKIIIGLREKKSFIHSLYKHYIKRGGMLPFNKWCNNELNKDYLDFNKYVNHIKSLFDNVFIYHYEELKKDTDTVIADMCGFMGVNIPSYENKKHNVGYIDEQVPIARFLNNFLPSGIVSQLLWLSGSRRWLHIFKYKVVTT